MHTDPQFSLYPFASPQTATMHAQRLARRVSHLENLHPVECLQILGELSLAELCVDRLEARPSRARLIAQSN